MKILLVNDYAIPQGGAEILLFNLRTALRKRGHDARLFASNAGSDGSNFADYHCLGTTSRFRTLLQTVNPWAAERLRRVLAEFRPDVVHVKMFLTQLSPLILPALRGFPSLYHVVWYRPICPLGTKMLPDRTICHSPSGLVCHRAGCLPWHNWLLLMFQMKLLRHWRSVFDLLVANSRHVRDRLLAEGMGPAEVLANGVGPRPGRSSMSTAPKAAFVGRLVREKGVDIVLQAFALVKKAIPEATLVICGDGPERKSLEKLAVDLRLGASVSIRGYCTAAQVDEAFRDSWVVVVPSIWEEPFGHVAIEAMSNGVSVVASNTGGLREIIRDGQTGFLCPPGNVEAFAEAMLKTLGNRALAEQLGAAAHNLAMSQFREDRLVDRLLELYRSINPNAA
jgi:glycosyltransferase involved in cell wall biosynthesis